MGVFEKQQLWQQTGSAHEIKFKNKLTVKTHFSHTIYLLSMCVCVCARMFVHLCVAHPSGTLQYEDISA